MTKSSSSSPFPARRLIPLFLVIVFLYWVGLYLYVPTLPLYLQTKTNDLTLVGTALSMYGLWQLIVRLPLGITADWFGRRKSFVILWLGLVAAGDLVLGFSNSIDQAIFGRALIGLAAACWVPLVVMFGSLFPPDEAVRATALASTVATFGRIAATAANGWLNSLGGYPLAFQLAAGAALLAAVLVLFVPETPRPRQPPSPQKLLDLGLRREVILPSLLQAAIHVGDFAATFTFIPIIARRLGASEVAISLLLSLNLGVVLLGNLISAGLAKRTSDRALSAASFLLMSAGIGGAALAPSLGWLFAAQFAIGLSLGLAYPLLMGLSIAQVSEAERTTAMGLHQSIYALGMFAGPWLAGVLADEMGIQGMFAVVAFLVLAAGLGGSTALRINPLAKRPE